MSGPQGLGDPRRGEERRTERFTRSETAGPDQRAVGSAAAAPGRAGPRSSAGPDQHADQRPEWPRIYRSGALTRVIYCRAQGPSAMASPRWPLVQKLEGLRTKVLAPARRRCGRAGPPGRPRPSSGLRHGLRPPFGAGLELAMRLQADGDGGGDGDGDGEEPATAALRAPFGAASGEERREWRQRMQAAAVALGWVHVPPRRFAARVMRWTRPRLPKHPQKTSKFRGGARHVTD